MPATTTDTASLGATLTRARAHLTASGIDDPATDARRIVEHYSGTSRRDAIVEPERPLGQPVLAAIEAALARRSAGEPVHRIFGFREFYGLRFSLSPATLEPRPDTETLVDAMLPLVHERVRTTGGCRILDLGTGTGAVVLALLANVAEATGVGTDISPDALATAARNAVELGLRGRFFPLESDWWERIDGVFDAIVSNPPYIESRSVETLGREVRDFDPRAALDGGTDGLGAYRSIAAGAARHLAEGGTVGVEIGAGQGEQVSSLFTQKGFTLASVHRDLGGHDRAMIFVR